MRVKTEIEGRFANRLHALRILLNAGERWRRQNRFRKASQRGSGRWENVNLLGDFSEQTGANFG